MILTQLVYLHPGKEALFDQFEAIAIPLIAKYRGELLLRLRPTEETVIGPAKIEFLPYEIHLVRFESEEDLARFSADEERKKVLPLKDESVRSAIIIKGNS